MPIWSPLTDFEEWAITGEHSSLRKKLALAIVASGDVRTWGTYLPLEKKVLAFVKIKTSQIRKEKDIEQKGYILFHEMQKYFYPNVISSHPTYSFNQTRLSELLKDGNYNCMSSALLYLLLADFYNLNAKGVLVPYHAFAQINDGQGSTIDVETTNPIGYHQVHDSAYYGSGEVEWYSEEAKGPTYEDYLERKIISLKKMIIRNMSNQHTSDTIMAVSDRMRLVEIKVYLEDNNAYHLSHLIDFYQREARHLLKEGDSLTLGRFFRKIGPRLFELGERYNHLPEYYTKYRELLEVGFQHLQVVDKDDWLKSYLEESVELFPETDSNRVLLVKYFN
ncbi:MAG: hypothetical protein OCC49_09785 [Fibrobacterales bacterium]